MHPTEEDKKLIIELWNMGARVPCIETQLREQLGRHVTQPTLANWIRRMVRTGIIKGR